MLNDQIKIFLYTGLECVHNLLKNAKLAQQIFPFKNAGIQLAQKAFNDVKNQPLVKEFSGN